MRIQAELNFAPCSGERVGAEGVINAFMNGLQALMAEHEVQYVRAWEQGEGQSAEPLPGLPGGSESKPD